VLLLCVVLGEFSASIRGLSAQSAAKTVILISVMDGDRNPLAGVTIEGRSGSAVLCKATTDAHGLATLNDCGSAAGLRLTASLAGYIPATTAVSLQNQGAIEFTLSKRIVVEQTTEVRADSQSALTEAASSESKLPMENATVTPLRPSTLVDALPLVPGVIRTPDGRVQIAGQDEEHSSLLINSVNVNDPATGSFGLSVPIDSVDILKVMQSPYLAQYGNFTAGIVSAETRRGGDKFRYSLNDPLPDSRIRSGHLVGFADASPRLNLSGPLIKNRLYFLEGFEYLMSKAQVRTLPFPENVTRSDAYNSFTQIDALLGARNSITATLHFAPHSVQYATLNYFDPQPVTPNADYQENTGTISEHLGIGGGVVTSTFSGTRFVTNVTAQTLGEMALSPVGNSGSYFGQQSREATRFQWMEAWKSPSFNRLGQHSLQLGTVLAHAEDDGQVIDRNVSIQGASGQLLQTITYDGNGAFSLSDLESAVYAQDHWILNSHVALDTGLRWETQSLTHTSRFAPRSGFTWTPRTDNATVIRGGIGVFYDTLPLNTYAFSSYPQQIVTTYDGSGNVTNGPRRYQNITSNASGFPLILQQNTSGNFAPYSVAWNVEAEHEVTESLMLRVRYIHADGQNQLTLAPEITPARSALVLGGSGTLQSNQTELTARLGANTQRQFFFSYVRQSARGDQTDVSSYLGDFPMPVVSSPIIASTPGEVPNRFLLWGTSVLPMRMRITPHVEYRDGFTWQPMDALQNNIPLSSYQPRYPRYFSADVRASKDLNVGPHHAVRLSFTIRNLTNHTNPLQIHNNVADPQYGMFFGNYGRHYLLDFDFLY
jgi:outer membrane receptor for ferrienterochelin and colicin